MAGERNHSTNVLVVGGGVAALEFVLAARKLAEERLRCTLVTPGTEFSYRPAAVTAVAKADKNMRLPTTSASQSSNPAPTWPPATWQASCPPTTASSSPTHRSASSSASSPPARSRNSRRGDQSQPRRNRA